VTRSLEYFANRSLYETFVFLALSHINIIADSQARSERSDGEDVGILDKRFLVFVHQKCPTLTIQIRHVDPSIPDLLQLRDRVASNAGYRPFFVCRKSNASRIKDCCSEMRNVDVGTPPIGYRGWEIARVRFHSFANLPTITDEPVYSPQFRCFGHSWCLKIYAGGEADTANGVVSVYLKNMTSKSIELQFCFSVRNSGGVEVVDYRSKKTFVFAPTGTTVDNETAPAWGTKEFAKLNLLVGALNDGTLEVEVRMRIAKSNNHLQAMFVPKNPFVREIQKMFLDAESSDVVFEVGSSSSDDDSSSSSGLATTFNAHKLILQRCAPTLYEICGDGEDTVPIQNVKPDCFHYMLSYCYGHKVPYEVMKMNAKDIIDASDKFGVSNLKLEAEAVFVDNTKISMDNMLELLLYADSMNCALLKESVMDFIVKNSLTVLEKITISELPQGLFGDLLTAMTRDKEKKKPSSADKLSIMTVSELRKRLDDLGLEVDGSRESLIATLKEHQATPSRRTERENSARGSTV